MDFKTGDVVLFRTKFNILKPLTWIVPIIRFLVGTVYNHAGVILVTDKPYIIEAAEMGVVKHTADKIFDSRFESVKILRRSTMDVNIITSRIANTLGKKYDFSSLFFYQLIFQITGLWIGKKGKGDDKFYCTEYVAYIHQDLFPKWWEADHKVFSKKMDTVWKK